MAAPEVGGRQRRHEELLVLPVIRRVALDLPAAHRRQLARLRLDDFAASDVLDRLKPRRMIFYQNSNIVAFGRRRRLPFSGACATPSRSIFPF